MGEESLEHGLVVGNITNALSVLPLLSASPAGTDVTVSWQSVAGVKYFLERSTNLEASPPFTLLAPNLHGQPGTTSFTDTNAAKGFCRAQNLGKRTSDDVPRRASFISERGVRDAAFSVRLARGRADKRGPWGTPARDRKTKLACRPASIIPEATVSGDRSCVRPRCPAQAQRRSRRAPAAG